MLETLPGLQDGFFVRPPTLEDADIVSDMLNICSIDLLGKEQYEPSDFEMSWQTPDFELENAVRLVFSPENQLVGYCSVGIHQEPFVNLGITVRIHPEYRNKGIGGVLMAWGEGLAHGVIDQAPEGARVALGSGCNQKDEYSKTLFEKNGMEIIRHYFQMEIEFDSSPSEPEIPEGIVIRPWDQDTEIEALGRAYMDSFRDHFGFTEMPINKLVEYIQYMISKDPYYDPALWWVAVEGEEIAGLLIGSPKTTEDPDMGYVAVLGVRRPWRKRGLGLALLQHSFVEFYKRGSKRSGLGVDASSLTGATRLYEKAGMRVTRQYDSYQKVLREGEDLTTTSL
jgi:GNAT superfamily N-acetyltransferase